MPAEGSVDRHRAPSSCEDAQDDIDREQGRQDQSGMVATTAQDLAAEPAKPPWIVAGRRMSRTACSIAAVAFLQLVAGGEVEGDRAGGCLALMADLDRGGRRDQLREGGQRHHGRPWC
ncbi:MAG: hypothetical protein U1E17_13390 [Geminicoccaceae bacterium]